MDAKQAREPKVIDRKVLGMIILMDKTLPAISHRITPPMPENSLGLKNFTILRVTDKFPADQFELFDLYPNDEIAVAWDGDYVIYSWMTWEVEQLCDEIRAGYWEIVEFKPEVQ